MSFSHIILIATDTILSPLEYLWIVSSNPFSCSVCRLISSLRCTDQNSAKYSMETLCRSPKSSLWTALLSCTLFSPKVAVNFQDWQQALVKSRRLPTPPVFPQLHQNLGKIISWDNYNAHLVYFPFLREGSLSYVVWSPMFWVFCFIYFVQFFGYFRWDCKSSLCYPILARNRNKTTVCVFFYLFQALVKFSLEWLCRGKSTYN